MACFKLPDVSIIVYILIAIFAISSWVDIVGLWVELPLMVNKLPERWNLPSYMALVIQLANIGPALYSFISKVSSLKKNSSNNETSSKDIVLSLLIILTEIVSMFLMSFFWDSTIIVGGESRSIPMLLLLSICGICSCLSSVVFLPYMARYSVHYLSAYYLGNGLSGLIPGLTGLAQGLGGEPKCVNMTEPINESCTEITCPTKFRLVPEYPPPKFSVQVYLIFICCLLVTSLVSFYCLNYTKLRSFQIVRVHPSKTGKVYTIEEANEQPDQDQLKEIQSNKELLERESEIPTMGRFSCKLIFYLTMVALLNAATNGLIPSIQSYTCLPYGNVVYSLAVRLSSVVGALSSLSTMFLPRPNEKVIAGLTSLGLCIVSFHFVLALQSPTPLLQHSIFGSILVVTTCLVMSACFSFVRVSVASVLHSFGGRRALLWCGGITQVGSFFGAMLGFILVNWTKLFTSIKPCQGLT